MKAVLAALLALTGSAASAQVVDEYCNDYWFVRNQVINAAGYCFGSPLGQAIFDNSDCTPGPVTLSPEHQALVDRIAGIERAGGCKVDTSATSLPIPLLHLRLQLEDFAMRDPDSGFGCFGYTGPGFMLWAGHRESGVPISEVTPGDDLIYLYWAPEAPPGWTYLDVKRDGEPVGLGWTNVSVSDEDCTQVAG